MLPLGQWLLEEVGAQLQRFNQLRSADPPLTASINISPKQFKHPSFVASVRDTLTRTGADGRLLRFEITEGPLMQRADATIDLMEQLRELGIEFELDDFGAGHSSLSALHQLPLSVLKIDRSFLAPRGSNRDYTAVMSAVVKLAHNLGMKVTAERVETPKQLAQMIAMQCDFVQGFLLGMPITLEQTIELLSRPSISVELPEFKAAA